MELEALNDRWKSTEKAHAVAKGQGHVWLCPLCGVTDQTEQSLSGAMSDALAHKGRCKAVS